MVQPTLVNLDHITPTGTTTSLISDFFSAPIFTDVGTGEVNNAIIVLSANNGKYITSSPVIDGYDRIRLVLLDEDANIYQKVFEVILTVPVETKTSGTKLELHLIGIEHHLQKINYIKPWYGADAYSVVSDIANYYNTNRGSLQPLLTAINSTQIALPTWTQNNFDFGLNQETCYNRILQVCDKMGNSVGGGGVLDFFEVDAFTAGGYTTPPTMTLQVSSSGSVDTGIVIQNTTSVNVGPTEGGIQAIKGTLLCGWGDAESGSLHPDWSRFSSQETMFGLHQQWQSGVTYLFDARVQISGTHYKCTNVNGTTTTPPSADWATITTNSEYGNTITYSYFTRNNQQLWKNSGSNPNDLHNSDVRGIGFYDSNLVIWDDTTFRTWVNCKATSSADITTSSLSHLLYGGTDFYRGFRVLVNTASPGSPWTGNDINGVSFANKVVEYDGTNWTVKYASLSTGSVVASLYDGSCYKFTAGSWTDISTTANAVDCFHPWTNFGNIPGIYGSCDAYGGTPVDTSFTANTNSAVRVEYRWGTLLGGNNTKNWYQSGAWLDFSVPFPENNFGGIGQVVGQLYGGAIQSGGVPDANKEPVTIDAENMHLTHDGYRGFNKTSALDFGNLSSIDFHIRIWYQAPTSITGLGAPDWTQPVYNIQAANFQMRCSIYDTSDNVVFQDFQIPFFGNWAPIKLPLEGFQLYRARRPNATGFDTIIPPKALDSNNVFEWRNIKRIVIQTQDSYDSNGRYMPYDPAATFGAGSKFYSAVVNDAATGLPIPPPFSAFRRIMLDLDSFRFTKPLFATTGTVSDRNIQPDFIERPLLILYDDLANECFSQLAISKFRHVEYDMETTGKFDIPHGNTFYLYNPRLVPNRLSDGTPVDTNLGGGTGDLLWDGVHTHGMPASATHTGNRYDNTVKLVNKRTEYSITKPSDAPGGFLRKLVGIKRFQAT